MNDFDFDKSFSEDFRKNRMEAPSPEKWERMEASLRQMKEQKRRKRGIFFLLLPYLLLAGTAGAFVWQWQTSQQLMAGLQGRVTDLEKKLAACGQLSVTTVPETPKGEAGKTAQLAPAKVPPSGPRRTPFAKPTYGSNLGSTERWQPQVFQGAKTAMAGPEKAIEAVAQQNLMADGKPIAEAPPTDTLEAAKTALTPTPKQRTNRSPLPAQEHAQLASTENNSVEIDAAVKPVFVKEPKAPKGFVVGLVGSLNYFYFGGDGKNIGIITQYRIKKGWCIQAGYDYGRNRFRGKIEFDSTAIIYPTPPGQGYNSLNITNKLFKSTFHLGVRKYFLLQKRLQPSLSLEWVGVGWHKEQSKYRWDNVDATKPTINTSKTSKIGLWNLSTYQVSGALSYRIHSRVELMAQTGLHVFAKRYGYRHKFWHYQLGVLGYF